MEAFTHQHSEFIAQYIPLVEFLGQSMGPNVEVVLHDLDVPDQSIVAIANGHVSGRKIGGPVTDFALWFMKQGDANHVPMMTGYRAVNSEGRICRSSSYFLRDQNNVMHGMLCINVDISDLVQIKNLSTQLLGPNPLDAPDKAEAFGGYTANAPEILPLEAHLPNTAEEAATEETFAEEQIPNNVSSLLDRKPIKLPPSEMDPQGKEPEEDPEQQDEKVVESLRSNIQNLLESMLNKAISQHDVAPERMQREERIEVVRELENAGFFLLKGGIAAAANHLDVSEPTIYRYLVEVRD